VEAKEMEHENTWSEFYKLHTNSDSLSSTAVLSTAALQHKDVYQLGHPVTALVLGTAIEETHCTILFRLAIQ
jgi:hypothetical protein